MRMHCIITGLEDCRSKDCPAHYSLAPMRFAFPGNGFDVPVGPTDPRWFANIDWTAVDLTARARVGRGLHYLRTVYPLAIERIQLSTLDMTSYRMCVLGQLHGGFQNCPEVTLHSPQWIVAHGFMATPAWRVPDWMDEGALLVQWHEALTTGSDR
jgi:hypothetical protein